MVASLDAWTKLLESIGIGLKAMAIDGIGTSPSHYFSLQSIDGKHDVYVQDNETRLPWRPFCLSIQDLEDILLKYGRVFIVRGRGETAIETIVQNPWLGCRSLEEAFIRKDLLGNELSN